MSSSGQREITQEIIEGCSAKDKSCQKIVYEHFYKSMYAICLRYSANGDEAKDLLHEGFIKLFKKSKLYKGDAEFGIWVKRLFINHCIDYVRSAYKRYVHYFDTIYTDETEELSYEDESNDYPSKKEVFSAMNEIRADYRLILNLYAIENYSHAEIAEKLGIKEASSRSKLSRARIALKKQLNLG